MLHREWQPEVNMAELPCVPDLAAPAQRMDSLPVYTHTV